MANWASTSYRIEGNQKDLQELYNLCKAFMDKERPVMEEGASENWGGNIILALGEEIDGSYIRGFIQERKLSDGLLSIEAEEAWDATDFRHLLENHYENMKVYFIVEEEGCEVYATNDAAGRIGRDSATMDEIEEWNEEHEDNDEYININEYKIVD